MARKLHIRPDVEETVRKTIQIYPDFEQLWMTMKNRLRTEPHLAAHIVGSGISFMTSDEVPTAPVFRVIYSYDDLRVDVLAIPPD